MGFNLGKLLKDLIFAKVTTRLIFPIIGVVPPILIAGAEVKRAWPRWLFEGIAELDASHWWLRSSILFWPCLTIAGAATIDWIREQIEMHGKLGDRELIVLLRILDNPVGQKLTRLAKAAKAVKAGKASPDVFEQAINPHYQIQALVEGIYHAFIEEVDEVDGLKVTLARMNKGRIDDFEVFSPAGAGPKSRAEDLRTKDCSFSRAADTRRILIIPDIAKELKRKKERRCAPGGVGSSNEGSLLCYPVFLRELDDVPYVIGVKHSSKNAFTPNRTKRYEYILQRFSDRISLEFTVHYIKEATKP